MWYIRQVALYPTRLILIVLSVAILFTILSITQTKWPNFEDPLLGFEARGTELSKRTITWRNLLRSTDWNGPLTLRPGSIATDISKEAESSNGGGERGSGRIRTKRQSPISSSKTSNVGRNFMCNNPTKDYGHVIIKSVSGENLFSVKGLKGICDMDKKLRNSEYFPQLCEHTPRRSCCQSWSIANYVVLLRNLPTCNDIEQSDVTAVWTLLTICAPYYYNMTLNYDCAMVPELCLGVPSRCIEHDAVYNILNFLADTDFVRPGHSTANLTSTAVFLPIAQSIAALNYYQDLENGKLNNEFVEVVGVEFGLKYKLFSMALQHEIIYVGFAGVFIFLCLWIYSSSLLVTFMTFCGGLFSMVTAYFMYSLVYRIKFFPFINLLTIILIIGVGADDACIYAKIWATTNTEKTENADHMLIRQVRLTLQHAFLSMFVTSMTTAMALFSGIISDITAVRCFSIFAGTAVLANFLFTILWLPASVVISDRWFFNTSALISELQFIPRISSICTTLRKVTNFLTKCSRAFFEKILPSILVEEKYYWTILVSVLATCAGVVVFYYPGIQPPNSQELQLFKVNHLFEQYDLYLKKSFWFESTDEQDIFRRLPIRIVWGVLPDDTGNYLDPYDRGSLTFDRNFNIAKPEAQLWLLNFCIHLRNQSFYQLTSGPRLFNCLIETFQVWMGRRCVDVMTNLNRTPCCESSKFPYSEEVFNQCIKEGVSLLYSNPGFFGVSTNPGMWFSKLTGNIQAFSVQYDSTYSYSNSYTEMKQFHHTINGWVNDMLKTAPESLRNGWFISDLDFFDLQDSLSKGMLTSIGVAIAATFIALLLTTLDFLISVFAIITISCIIIVTVAGLVLLGWKINVIESTIVNLAIGLAVDLTIHYGVAYRNSTEEDRKSKVRFALRKIGSSVAMAAFTTIMAGALILPSTILAYLQIGTFLVVLMSISWLHSTFLFLPLLSIAGPIKKFLQLNYPFFFTVCVNSESSSVLVDDFVLSDATLFSNTSTISRETSVFDMPSISSEPLYDVPSVPSVPQYDVPSVPQYGVPSVPQYGVSSIPSVSSIPPSI